MSASFNFDSSGRVRKGTAQEVAQADENNGILVLSKGIQADGRPYFAYIAVKPSLYQEFYQLTSEHMPINLEDYGQIIISGIKAEPLEETKQFMRDVYGFEDDFEERLVAELKKQKVLHVKKHEDNRISDIVSMLKKQKPGGNA